MATRRVNQRDSIALVVTQLRIGGAERQLALLAKGLCRRGWQVSVLSLKTPLSLLGLSSCRGIEVRTLGLDHWWDGPSALIRLVHYMRRVRPGLMHAHLFHADLAGRLASLLDGSLPLVVTMHGAGRQGGLRGALQRLGQRRVAHFTHVSGQCLEELRRSGRIPADRSSLIPNGVECDEAVMSAAEAGRWRSTQELDGHAVWACIGRFHATKGQEDLIQALSPSDPWTRRARLVFIGDGPRRKSCEALAARRGLSAYVRFLGEVPDARRLLAACDGLIVPSHSEAAPMAILETFAAALPVVAFRVGGIEELVEHESRGLVVEHGAYDNLMSAIAELSQAAERRRALGQEAREWVRGRSGLEVTLDRWETLYMNVRESKATGSCC